MTNSLRIGRSPFLPGKLTNFPLGHLQVRKLLTSYSQRVNPHQIPLNHHFDHFPMVFLWLPYGLPEGPRAPVSSRSCKRRRMWPSTMTTRSDGFEEIGLFWDIYVDTHYVYIYTSCILCMYIYIYMYTYICRYTYHLYDYMICLCSNLGIRRKRDPKGVHGFGPPAVLFDRCLVVFF